jgi:hypothetical protein
MIKLTENDVNVLLIDIINAVTKVSPVYHIEDFVRSKLGWVVKDEILENVNEVVNQFKQNKLNVSSTTERTERASAIL